MTGPAEPPRSPPDAGSKPAYDPATVPVLFHPPRWLVPAFRWHRLAFAAVNAAAIGANVLVGPPWWSLWVAVASIALLGLHYLAYKMMTIDDAWVDARAEEVHLKSYDRGHIQEMSERRGLSTPADRVKRRKR